MSINIVYEILKYFDCFGTAFNFYTEKNRKYYTSSGGILTLLSIIFSIIIFIYINLDEFRHNLPNSSTSTEREKHHLIKFKEEKIWIPWRIRDFNGKTMNHTNLFYPMIYYYKAKWDDEINKMQISYELIDYKLCNETSMVNDTDFYMLDIELDQLYCIDMEDLEVGGYWDYEFVNLIALDIYACKNGIDYDENNTNCTSYEKYIEIAGNNNSFEFEMFYPVVHYQPINKNVPIFIEYTNYFYHFSRYSNKIDRIYLQQHILIDDKGWFLIKEKKYSKWGFVSLSGDSYTKGDEHDLMLNEGSTSRFYSLNIYLKSNIIYYYRSYKKVYLIFANGLPIINIVIIFFGIIAKIFKISSGNKKLTELLFENLKEKKTFFTKKIIMNKKSDNTHDDINHHFSQSNININGNNNNSNLLLNNKIDFSSFQLTHPDSVNNNLFGSAKFPENGKKSKFSRNVKTQINANIFNNKNYNNIFVFGENNNINDNMNNNINDDNLNKNLDEDKEDAFNKKIINGQFSSSSNNKKFFINNNEGNNNNEVNDNNEMMSNNKCVSRGHTKLNIKAKTHYIKKTLFPYKYYLCSIFIKNIDISKGSFFFTKKFIAVYNFICQLFDISSYLILQREFQIMKNTVIEEKQRHIIEKEHKINVGADSFNISMKELLDNKKLSIFGKIK